MRRHYRHTNTKTASKLQSLKLSKSYCSQHKATAHSLSLPRCFWKTTYRFHLFLEIGPNFFAHIKYRAVASETAKINLFFPAKNGNVNIIWKLYFACTSFELTVSNMNHSSVSACLTPLGTRTHTQPLFKNQKVHNFYTAALHRKTELKFRLIKKQNWSSKKKNFLNFCSSRNPKHSDQPAEIN